MSWLRPPRSQHVLSEVKLASVCHWMHKYEEVNITPSLFHVDLKLKYWSWISSPQRNRRRSGFLVFICFSFGLSLVWCSGTDRITDGEHFHKKPEPEPRDRQQTVMGNAPDIRSWEIVNQCTYFLHFNDLCDSRTCLSLLGMLVMNIYDVTQ